ncbi:MAG: helix-turn-helix transcriptional regulator [Bacilli bacterium]|nr:helix-turn-helix transcriptional regulator [Bacilli bacterium]
MDNNQEYDLKLILLAGREKKGLSQRKLAKKIGIHHSSLNDIENGKIKKIDVEVLRKIAEELDLSLELLMKAAGYNQVAYMFKQNGNSLDNKSTKDLKNLIEEYRMSQMDLLDDSYQKRSNVRDCRTRLHSLIIKLENYDMYKDMWTIEKITEELKEINKALIKSANKYDYSKLPNDNP